ncbi:MAG: hypothetical protein ACK4P3_00510 [Fimbriimonadaceae bacterium]
MRNIKIGLAAAALGCSLLAVGCAGGSSSSLTPTLPNGCGGGSLSLVFQPLFPGSADTSSFIATRIISSLTSERFTARASFCPEPSDRTREVDFTIMGEVVQGRSYLVGTDGNTMFYTERNLQFPGELESTWQGSGTVVIANIANNGDVTLSFDVTFTPRPDIIGDPATGSFQIQGTGTIEGAFTPR